MLMATRLLRQGSGRTALSRLDWAHTAEITEMLDRAVSAVGPDWLWVNPDCGLTTRSTVQAAPRNMVTAARDVRSRGREPSLSRPVDPQNVSCRPLPSYLDFRVLPVIPRSRKSWTEVTRIRRVAVQNPKARSQRSQECSAAEGNRCAKHRRLRVDMTPLISSDG